MYKITIESPWSQGYREYIGVGLKGSSLGRGFIDLVTKPNTYRSININHIVLLEIIKQLT